MKDAKAEPICLACGADDAFSMPLAVMLRSVMANLRSDSGILLYIVDGGIRGENKKKILDSLGGCTEVNWLKPNFKLLSRFFVSDRIPVATYFRIFIPELLPHRIEKAIYLDADLVVLGNLEELWRVPLHDHYVLAAPEAYITSPACNEDVIGRWPKGGKSGVDYFNSGVLVMNLQKWRQSGLTRRMTELAVEHGSRYNYHDQSLMNDVLKGNWGELDPRWNQQMFYYEYPRMEENPMSAAVYRRLMDEPHVVHFSYQRKPWLNMWDGHPGKKYFFEYLDQTAWRGWRPTLKEVLWDRIKNKRKGL